MFACIFIIVNSTVVLCLYYIPKLYALLSTDYENTCVKKNDEAQPTMHEADRMSLGCDAKKDNKDDDYKTKNNISDGIFTVPIKSKISDTDISNRVYPEGFIRIRDHRHSEEILAAQAVGAQ